MLLAAFISGLCFFQVAAQETTITSQQADLIKDNCVSVKNTLTQLHASDALLRVNSGQVYESISTKLMKGFNTRVGNNHYNNADLLAATAAFDSTLNTFRSDYISYEEQLSTAISIDCSKQPVAFYDAVAVAQTKRDQVHADIVRLNKYITQYQLAIDQLEKDYQSGNASGVSQ